MNTRPVLSGLGAGALGIRGVLYHCMKLLTGSLTLSTAPSEPQNLVVASVSSFALDVSWEPPADNGGRPISGYYVTVNNTEMMVEPGALSLRVRDEEVLMENTTYK